MSSLPLRRSLIGVVALSVALVGAGCEEAEPSDPVASPSESSESAPTSPSEPTTDARPSLSPVGTVRAWIDAYNAALGNGATDDLLALTAPDCETCDELRVALEEVHGAGGFFRGGRWMVDAAEVTSRSADTATVTTGITVAEGMTKSTDDADPESYLKEQLALEFHIDRGSNGSAVTQIVFLS